MALSETFENTVFRKTEDNTFELCVFNRCTFEDISDCKFLQCEFHSCNFSNCKTNGTSIQETLFDTCKMLGVDFSRCNKFMMSFEFRNCVLDYSNFTKTEIPRTIFRNCSMKEVLFEGTDLRDSDFSESDLQRASFHNCNLSHCDFSTARNYCIFPENNNMKRAKFSISGLQGLLTKFDIEICG